MALAKGKGGKGTAKGDVGAKGVSPKSAGRGGAYGHRKARCRHLDVERQG